VKSFALEPIEKASLDELKALQLERLRWSLDHAYRNVARYRQKFDAARVQPSDCRSLADLAKFPFTTKADLRETYPFGMFAVPMDKIVRIHASSGTTGKPTVVGYTRLDIRTWADVCARSIYASGGRHLAAFAVTLTKPRDLDSAEQCLAEFVTRTRSSLHACGVRYTPATEVIQLRL